MGLLSFFANSFFALLSESRVSEELSLLSIQGFLSEDAKV